MNPFLKPTASAMIAVTNGKEKEPIPPPVEANPTATPFLKYLPTIAITTGYIPEYPNPVRNVKTAVAVAFLYRMVKKRKIVQQQVRNRSMNSCLIPHFIAKINNLPVKIPIQSTETIKAPVATGD